MSVTTVKGKLEKLIKDFGQLFGYCVSSDSVCGTEFMEEVALQPLGPCYNQE